MPSGKERRNISEIDDQLPTIRAIPFSDAGAVRRARLLSHKQREAIAAIAVRIHVRKHRIVYHEHTPADSVFIVARGTLKVFRNLPSGRRPVLAFLFAEDLFGLSEAGAYVNTVQAVTDVSLFRMPLQALKDVLVRDAHLQLEMLAKVIHELREAQRHTILVERRAATGRLATFLRLLEAHRGRERSGTIAIPMSRLDVADYLGLSPEAVSRAVRSLQQSKIVTFSGRHTARVIDYPRFDRLATGF